MSFAKVFSAQTYLLNAHVVDVEVDLSQGLHNFSVVGLPDKAVEEARDRVSAGIKNSGFSSPKSHNQKIVVSLAPADLKKEGSHFDLAIALAYLLAQKEISFKPEGKLFLGELSLNGAVRSVPGILPLVREAATRGFTEAFVPEANVAEASLIGNIAVYGVPTLARLIEHLKGEPGKELAAAPHTSIEVPAHDFGVDFRDVRGQESAKRGLEIAAAGGHNIALWGPAGTGKTMLARAFTSILPPLQFEEVLEVTAIHSVAGALRAPYIADAPFRAPHHTSSYVALVGGGTFPRPGEVTLAHRGVLFMDEFAEFERRVIEALRQPLEDRVVTIARSKGSGVFPANFILVAAMNPCPCGNWGSGKECRCAAGDILRYQKKISGPIADRIDMWIEVPLLPHEKLSGREEGEDSAQVRERVSAARGRQSTRFKEHARINLNSDMGARELSALVPLSQEVETLLNTSARALTLSPRAYHRVIKLARTIADLEDSESIHENHLLEALQYRPKQNETLA